MGQAVVTGAAQGLGKAIATRLSADGFQLHLLDVNEILLARAAKELSATPHVADVRNRDRLSEVAKEIGEIEVLINNAGIWRFSPIVESSDEELDDVLEVNLVGTVNAVRAFAPYFTNPAAVVNLSSAAASMRTPGIGMYPTAKAAIEALTAQLSGELGPKGVRVNAVAPGLIRTEGTAASYSNDAPTQRAQSVPLRRIGEPNDIANVVSFLVSAQSSYVSGQTIGVDGGVIASRCSI
jgi:3-oxoacyl-[acyl-carrier protein] reductase